VVQACIGLAKRCPFNAKYGRVSVSVKMKPALEMTKKGGTTTGTLFRYIDTVIDRAWPNIAPDWKYDTDGSEDSVGT
jgi:hypothetical protein